MMNKAKTLLLLLLLPPALFADYDEEMLSNRIKSINERMEITDIRKSEAPGILELEINNKEYIYATEDAEYIFTGNLVNISDSSFINITENRAAERRKTKLEAIDPGSFITFKAPEETDSLYVFTDVSCGYCKKFHQHIKEINAMGITIHYIAFPRAGITSSAAELMKHAWCSSDRNEALTEAKENDKVSQHPLPCTSPILAHYTLAYDLGVSGTPAIYDKNGHTLGGYLSPDEIKKAIK